MRSGVQAEQLGFRAQRSRQKPLLTCSSVHYDDAYIYHRICRKARQPHEASANQLAPRTRPLVAMVATIKSAGTGAIASMIAGVIMMGWIVGVSASPGNALATVSALYSHQGWYKKASLNMTFFVLAQNTHSVFAGYAGLFERLATNTDTIWSLVLVARLWVRRSTGVWELASGKPHRQTFGDKTPRERTWVVS